eukprot:gb/GECH01011473.1/.p1 GENE.gb/GECH01011473.1/~~gb/GECH01011473.1/.p1  ORF type:complete len:429 (+),score=77.96 gb/GECH01011473.1/:1-1287(+)
MKFLGIFVALVALFNYVVATVEPPSDLGVTQHSGYITVDKEIDGNLFYWFFESQHDPSNDPVVLWLTGGPGCSSMLALFTENGPFKVNDDGTGTTPNPYSWNKRANMLWVDQPVGTGFSYADSPKDYVRSEKQVAEDMYVFLQKFFKKYPQYSKQDFFVTGESYGGHYVPAVSARIFYGNKNGDGDHINFKGLAIGNGWVSPSVQYAQYGPFSYENSLIDKDTYRSVNRSVDSCQKYIKEQNWTLAQLYCNNIESKILNAAGNINVYNIKEKCKHKPLCYDFDNVIKYLNTPSVKQRIGARSDIKWETCNMNVHSKLMTDWYESFRKDLPPLLHNNIRVLIYSGDLDFICNWYGGRAWVSTMDWAGKEGYNRAPLNTWTVNHSTAGTAKTFKSLTFLRVFQAGHMVPLDQPVNALTMLNTFTSGQDFN